MVRSLADRTFQLRLQVPRHAAHELSARRAAEVHRALHGHVPQASEHQVLGVGPVHERLPRGLPGVQPARRDPGRPRGDPRVHRLVERFDIEPISDFSAK